MKSDARGAQAAASRAARSAASSTNSDKREAGQMQLPSKKSGKRKKGQVSAKAKRKKTSRSHLHREEKRRKSQMERKQLLELDLEDKIVRCQFWSQKTFSNISAAVDGLEDYRAPPKEHPDHPQTTSKSRF